MVLYLWKKCTFCGLEVQEIFILKKNCARLKILVEKKTKELSFYPESCNPKQLSVQQGDLDKADIEISH